MKLKKYDILFLGETWQYKANLDNLHHHLGHFHDFVYRKNFNTNGVPPGVVYYRSVLQGKVLVYDKSSENINCIKIDKGVNNYEHSIFAACVYNSLELLLRCVFTIALKSLRCTKFYDSNVIDMLEQQLKNFPLKI